MGRDGREVLFLSALPEFQDATVWVALPWIERLADETSDGRVWTSGFGVNES